VPFAGELSAIGLKVALNTFNVTAEFFTTNGEGAVPVTVTGWVPTIAGVIPLIVMVTGVPSACAVVGLKLTVVPAGFPVAENVVV